MSLIAVAAHTRRPGTLFRLLLLTVLVIAGLVAMHALNTHSTATGHGAASMSVATDFDSARVHGTEALHGIESAASMSAHVSHHGAPAGSAFTPSSDEHSMAWMACVLALLVAVIAFISAVGRRLPGTRAQLASAMLGRWHVVAYALPPPSLTVLCIRRT